MTTPSSSGSATHLDAASKVLEAALHVGTRGPQLGTPAVPRAFVTVSRQPGAGGISFSHRLAERLNADGAGDWSAWDRELVERVAAETNVSQGLIETIPDRHRSWFTTLLDAISSHPQPPDLAEVRAYKGVIKAIRALAERGHAIIVGQGGTFVTEAMPGAIHLRLVAPLEHRIKHFAEREQISLHEAAARLEEADVHRAEFFRRFWQLKVIRPEQFTMTLNAGELSVDEMIDAVIPVIRLREAALTGANASAPAPAAGSEKKRCHECAHGAACPRKSSRPASTKSGGSCANCR